MSIETAMEIAERLRFECMEEDGQGVYTGFDIEEAAKIVAAAIEAVVEKAVEEEREASKLFTRQRSDLHKADIEYLKQAANSFNTDLIAAQVEIERLQADLEAAKAQADAEMLRVKACEHIAEGDEGWEALQNECPSTAAVAKLRREVVAAERRGANKEREAIAIHFENLAADASVFSATSSHQVMAELPQRSVLAAKREGRNERHEDATTGGYMDI